MDPEGHTSDNEGVKMALESLFSDPVLEEGLDPGCDKKLNIDDIPETVRPILLDKWQRLRSKLDNARPRGSGSSSARNEEYYQNIEEKLSSVEAELKAKTMETEESAKRIEEFHTEGVMNRQKFTELEQEHQRISSENMTLREDQDRKTREIADLSDVGKRREEELQRMDQELKRIGQELANANAAKCDALIRAEEVAAKEISLTYREKRLEDDRELMQQHINTLTEDLHVATEKANNCKREQISSDFKLQTDLEQKQEHIRMIENHQESLENNCEAMQARIESLCEKLKEARDSNTILEDRFNEELRSQINLSNLHKETVKNSEEKSTELLKAVEQLQNLLKNAANKYGTLEVDYQNAKITNREEIARRNEAIRGLRKELDDANNLLKTLAKDEELNILSPSAMTVSNILESGNTITQIYTQFVSSQSELKDAKDEIKRLNNYIEQILSEIEERAPQYKRQRIEYAKAMETIEELQVDLASQNVEELRKKLAAVLRENERHKRQIKDLGIQVVCLLREVEAARFGRTTQVGDLNSPTSVYNNESTDDQVISERLLCFKDISELQQKNAELLAVIREVAAKKVQVENQVTASENENLKLELKRIKSIVEDLRTARERQESLMHELVAQRDSYKSMANENTHTAAGIMENRIFSAGDNDSSLSNESLIRQNGAKRKKSESPNYSINDEDQDNYRAPENGGRKAEKELEELKIKFQSLVKENEENRMALSSKHSNAITALNNDLFNTQILLSKTEKNLAVARKEKTNLEVRVANSETSGVAMKAAFKEDEKKLQADLQSLRNECLNLRKKLLDMEKLHKCDSEDWEAREKEFREKLREAEVSIDEKKQIIDSLSKKSKNDEVHETKNQCEQRAMNAEDNLAKLKKETEQSKLEHVKTIRLLEKELDSLKTQLNDQVTRHRNELEEAESLLENSAQELAKRKNNFQENLDISSDNDPSIDNPYTPESKSKSQIVEPASCSMVQIQDEEELQDNSNTSTMNSSSIIIEGTEDEEEVDEEEEQNESREQMDDEEEHEYDEEDTNVDEEEEVEEEESELVEEGRENITLEDDAESEIQEEEQDERDEVDEGEEEDEEDVMDEDNEENEADSIGQDQQDVSDGEIIDDEVGGSAEVAQAVEAAMVAARRQVQENPPRDDDIVVLESSEDEDEEGIDDANDDDRGDNNKNVIRPEDENPQEGMEDVIEDQESPQLQFPEQSDDRRSNAAVRRDALMDAGGNSVVPEFGDMTATSSQRITVDSLQDSGIPQYQAHIPESSSNVVASGSRHGREAQGGNQFEDGRDDSVVPSTPKLGDGVLHSSQGVPGSSSNMNVIPEERSASGSLGAAPFGAGVPSTFVFGAHPNVRRETLGTSNVTSSSNRSTFDITSGPSGSMSDLAMHHGLDRTSIDFAQFTTSQAHVAQNQPTSGHDVNTMISSATSSQSSVGIPSPSTSRGEIQIQEDVEENVVVQEPTQHGQSSEIVTSSSGSANAGNQQLPGDTSSSQTHVAPPQQNPRGRSTSQQRRGIQRQPIVWDNAPNRNQAAQPPRNQAAQPPPVAASRGLHVPPRQRGGPRGRRPSRMFGAGRRGPRGGAS